MAMASCAVFQATVTARTIPQAGATEGSSRRILSPAALWDRTTTLAALGRDTRAFCIACKCAILVHVVLVVAMASTRSNLFVVAGDSETSLGQDKIRTSDTDTGAISAKMDPFGRIPKGEGSAVGGGSMEHQALVSIPMRERTRKTRTEPTERKADDCVDEKWVQNMGSLHYSLLMKSMEHTE